MLEWQASTASERSALHRIALYRSSVLNEALTAVFPGDSMKPGFLPYVCRLPR